MNKDFDTVTGHNWGTGRIQLDKGNFLLEFRPVEVHLKEDGSLDNEPSLCIVMVRPPDVGAFNIPEKIDAENASNLFVYGQLSLEMWNKALGEIGYEIKKL